MNKINYSKVRRSAQADLKKYERLGVKIFTEALKEQAKPVVPLLPMQDAYVKFYQAVFVDSATKEYNRIRQDNKQKALFPNDFFVSTWLEFIKNWVIQNLGQLIFDVTDTSQKKVNEIVAQGIADGLTPRQIEELLVEQIPDIKRARAIARTESTRAYNEGKRQSAIQWANETGRKLGKIAPSLDGQRVVQLGLQSHKFTKEEGSEFIEWLLCWMADKGIETWCVQFAAHARTKS